MAKNQISKSDSNDLCSLKQFHPLPKLVVFDLDYTLWPYWVDTHITLPIKKASDGTIRDAVGTKLRIYSDVVQVMETLKANDVLVAAASRTCEPPAAQDMLNYFDLDKYFDFKEIYPGEKTTHFDKIKRDSKVAYEDMLFFDDEERNIVAVSRLKVACFLVRKEFTMKTLRDGLALFLQKQKAK